MQFNKRLSVKRRNSRQQFIEEFVMLCTCFAPVTDNHAAIIDVRETVVFDDSHQACDHEYWQVIWSTNIRSLQVSTPSVLESGIISRKNNHRIHS